MAVAGIDRQQACAENTAGVMSLRSRRSEGWQSGLMRTPGKRVESAKALASSNLAPSASLRWQPFVTAKTAAP